ncbi:BrnA antitoxin family protein [Polynucleobacter sp. JS-Safj-400b-B2]|uniref:BrnA antitoxin family protein n=1 Tax=Polynucleobacter sp. JS-Safj-400b-B2 TaxID=2576921 RepID=UPI001C0C93AC|nr:BrnA antitoxin family protein [Polynucleobacter sp. JS-Safj-400b-B2]MBU3624937.1 BrnA antitoxin family protein [Polynucleobacter sp. JS-Safj-400b-B2]
MKKKLIRLSVEEDAAITKAALSDPDNPPITEEEWNAIKHRVVRGRGRPAGSGIKEQVTLRIDKDVLDFYKSKGEGWQTFINQVLGEVKRESKSISTVEKKLSKGTLMTNKFKAAA